MRRGRLAAFVDALVHDRRPQSFRAEPEDVEAMRAAIELRTPHAETATPSPEFVRDLHDQLRRDLNERPLRYREPRHIRVSRRSLLEGAAVAAAAGLGVAVDRAAISPEHHNGTPVSQQPLVPDSGDWQPVGPRAALAGGAVTRFDGSGAVGFVSEQQGTLLAVSGVCTHQGCLLQLNQPERRLDCPCHRAAFALSGDLLFSQLADRPGPLPRLKVRDLAGQVEVYVPRSV